MQRGQSSIRRNKASRRYPSRPFLGVGALIFRGKRILVIERGGAPLRGYWSLPGGIVETGETLAEAVRREVREETGLEVRPERIAAVFERIMPDARGRVEYHYVLVDYVCRVVGGVLQPADDCAGAAWVTRKELATYTLTEGTREVIERAWRNRNK
jgi:ADP-ribose pyrophosphatase YjhB (NUDIX family)